MRDAAELAVQRPERFGSTIADNLEYCRASRGDRPQGQHDASLQPRRAVGVFDSRVADVLVSLFDRGRDGFAHSLLDTADCAE
jgi:hypothetical protein